jgi:hypothetical protein
MLLVQSALNEGDNKEANLTQESDSNDNLDEKWDAFYDLKDTQTGVSYINQLLTNPPERVSGIFILLISPSVIEINSRTSFFAVSALTCGLHIVIYF